MHFVGSAGPSPPCRHATLLPQRERDGVPIKRLTKTSVRSDSAGGTYILATLGEGLHW